MTETIIKISLHKCVYNVDRILRRQDHNENKVTIILFINSFLGMDIERYKQNFNILSI